MVKVMNINCDIFKNFNKMKPALNPIQNVWLTLLYNCNLNCPWCYAGKACSKSSFMDYSTAVKLVDLLSDIGVKTITLIGGEPTLYPQLEQLLKYINSKNITATIVTNGLLLADQDYVERIVQCGANSFSLSIKGYSDDEYRVISNGKQNIQSVFKAIKNISSYSGVNLKISYVLMQDNISDFVKMIEKCKENGGKNFSFTFCYDFSGVEKDVSPYDIKDNILLPLKWFQDNYSTIDKVTNGKFRIKQSLPLCAWDKKILNELESKNQISYTCQLLKHTGLIFDPDFSIIPCNALHNVKLGKYLDDFSTADDFLHFWNSNEVSYFFKHFQTLPDESCLNCSEKIKCRGGCVSNWFNFSMNEFNEAVGGFRED